MLDDKEILFETKLVCFQFYIFEKHKTRINYCNINNRKPINEKGYCFIITFKYVLTDN